MHHAPGEVRQDDAPPRGNAWEVPRPEGARARADLKDTCFERQIELLVNPSVPPVRISAEPVVQGNTRVELRRIRVLPGQQMFAVGDSGPWLRRQRILPTIGKSEAVT
jgi:hypothetical protein